MESNKEQDFGICIVLAEYGTGHIDINQAVSNIRKIFSSAITPIKDNVSEWISVEDKPLVTIGALGWEVNEGVPDEFLAAVPYNDKTRPDEKNLWWIRHCVIEDEIGLCIVGDDLENIPAGWEIEDVQFYQPIPSPPKQ